MRLQSDNDPGFKILSKNQIILAVQDEDQVLSKDEKDV